MGGSRARGFLLLAIVLAGAGTAAYVISRIGPRTAAADKRAYDARIESLASASVRAYRSIPTRPLAEMASPADIASHLRSGVIGTPPDGFGASPDELLTEAADFMFHRFVQSGRDYAGWCRGRGLTLPPMKDLLGGLHMAGATYRDSFGTDPPPDMTPEQMFDRLAEYQAEHRAESTRIVALGAGPGGVAVAFGLAKAQQRNRSLLGQAETLPGSGRLDGALWGGGGSGFAYAWWGSGESNDEWLDRIGQTVYAEVGVIAKFANGVHRPLGLYYFWDPRAKRWRLHGVVIYNLDPAGGKGGPPLF